MTRTATAAWVIGAALAASSSTFAGQRPFLFAYDTNIVSTGNLELEQWLWVSGPSWGSPADGSSYWLWWGPVFGLTRHIEVAVPLQVRVYDGETWLTSFDGDIRWRLFPQDDRSGFQALLRTSYHQATTFTAQSPSRFDFTLSGSYGASTDPHVVLELGGQIGLPPPVGAASPVPIIGTYDVGFAYPFFDGDLQVSAESYGQLGVANAGPSRFSAGGSVAWTSGRFWVTLGLLVGLNRDAPDVLPRLIWAASL